MELKNPLSKYSADFLYVSRAGISGQINGGSPPAAGIAGRVYICTTSGGAYTLGYLYRDTGSVWQEIIPELSQIVGVSVDLIGGTVEYAANTAYLWDATGILWVAIGPIPITVIDGGNA